MGENDFGSISREIMDKIKFWKLIAGPFVRLSVCQQFTVDVL